MSSYFEHDSCITDQLRVTAFREAFDGDRSVAIRTDYLTMNLTCDEALRVAAQLLDAAAAAKNARTAT